MKWPEVFPLSTLSRAAHWHISSNFKSRRIIYVFQNITTKAAKCASMVQWLRYLPDIQWFPQRRRVQIPASLDTSAVSFPSRSPHSRQTQFIVEIFRRFCPWWPRHLCGKVNALPLNFVKFKI